MINRIRIQNYKSLIDVDVQLEPLTVLIGRSGTGKSNFVRAIRSLRDVLLSNDISDWMRSKPLGKDQAELSIDINIKSIDVSGSYHYSVTHRIGNNSISRHAESLTLGDIEVYRVEAGKWIIKPKVLPLPELGQGLVLSHINGSIEASYVYQLLSRGIGCYDFQGTVIQPGNNGKKGVGFLDDGNNYLQTVSGIMDDFSRVSDWTSITRSLNSLNRGVKTVELNLPERDRLQIGYSVGENTMTMDCSQESEGFRRYFATLLALNQAPTKPIMMFEHPENGIHPGALESLAYEFKRHVNRGRGQIILTTHSPQFLDHFPPESIRVVEIENQESKIGPLAVDQLDSLKRKLMSPSDLFSFDPARIEKPTSAAA